MTTPQDKFQGYEIILASKSPRRRELMKMTGLDFSIAPLVEVDEHYTADQLGSYNVPEFLSRKKAAAYQPTLTDGQLLITADTVVVLGNEILGKPCDANAARRMLAALSGHTHSVITGITISDRTSMSTFSAVTNVKFDRLSPEEIDYYVATFRPLDKAGAYGIQEYIGAIGVEHIDGSFYNVMGLPVHRLYRELEAFIAQR
jgi:septum formation protein